MCCINVNPDAFVEWGESILERKARIREDVKAEIADEAAAYQALPWFKRLFRSAPGTGEDAYFYIDEKNTRHGLFRLPLVGKEIHAARYCKTNNLPFSLDNKHDFFKG